MTKKLKVGSILIPALIGAAVIAGALTSFLLLKRSAPKPPPTVSSETSETEEAVAEPPRLVWSSFGANQVSGRIAGTRPARELISLGPTKQVRFEVKLPTKGATVQIFDPAGKEIVPGPAVTVTDKLNPETKTVTKIYELTENTQSGDWQVVVTGTGETGATAGTDPTYTVTVPTGATPLSISPHTSVVTEADQGITVTLTVEETTGGEVVPVTGASVIAIITDPNQGVTTLTLQETDPVTNPGTYSGLFTGDQPPGTYQVEYIIDGENAGGTSFTQITTGQFIVTTQASTTPSGYFKKYDINRANEVQIIGY